VAANEKEAIEESVAQLEASSPPRRSRPRGCRAGQKPKRQKSTDTAIYVRYHSKTYAEIPGWMEAYPKDVADIQKLAKDKGWEDFTVAEDVIEHGQHTEPHLLFGHSQEKKVVSVCTLDTGGTLQLENELFPRGFVKVGNLLSVGVGNATAKGLLEYVEYVIKKSDGELDSLVVADIEEDNTSSRRAFEAQGFHVVTTPVKLKYEEAFEPYNAEGCVFVAKFIDV
jgi:hypothetical protein